MLTKEITYTDYNGNVRKEKHYFHLTTSELARLELMTEGGMEQKLRDIIDSQDRAQIMRTFDSIIDMAYGVKSEDGRQFVKSPEIVKAFKETPAYDKFFMELLTNEKAAADFVNGIVADEIRQKLAEAEANGIVSRP